jgi:hypothetical protein
VLTYKTGAAGAPTAARNMAEYLLQESLVPGLSEKMATYYGYAPGQDGIVQVGGLPQQDMDQRIADLLGIDPTRALSVDEIANLLNGQTTRGEDIPGKKQTSPHGVRIAYIDFTLSAPKSFSVAHALAPTEAERAILDKCHRDAVDATLKLIAAQVGVVSKGDTRKNFTREPGHVAFVKFEHNTSRPVEKIQRIENGMEVTDFVAVGFGDMQRHTHCILPAVAVTDEGRVGAIHQHAIKDRILEWGSLYQAFLATNLHAHGVEAGLDDRRELTFHDRMAKLETVPQRINDLFSKRTVDGRIAAREFALSKGINYDTLSPEGKRAFLNSSITARRASKDASADLGVWKREAEAAGYHHRSVLRPDEKRPLPPREDRIRHAYETALPLLETQFRNRAVLEGSTARVAAAKGLIAAGIESGRDVNAVTAAFRTEGVVQDGEKTHVHWAYDPSARFARITTQLSADQEREAIGILSAAAADKSTALSPEAVERAVKRVEAEGFDFSTGHGLKQREVINRLAASGRAAVAVGIAGSGKSTLLRPLIEAWSEDGREVYGISLGWRQTQGLRDAGIGKKRLIPDRGTLVNAGINEQRTLAITPFLKRMEEGALKLDRNSVVVIDELGLVGTRQMLRIARLQEKHGFQIVGIGDDRQNASVEAGASIDLARRAFGADNVPELLSTVRQIKERDQVTSLMFRDGNALEALERKTEDGTLRIVGGGYEEAVKATVDLWDERRKANAEREHYTLGISVPTNEDGRRIGEEIRRRRMASGEIGETIVRLQAQDQAGSQYALDLSVGDQVRLFDRVFGRNSNNRQGFAGNNGSVLEVAGADEAHLFLKKAGGDVVRVEWEEFRQNVDRVRLALGYAVTIDARQSETLTEHIAAMPTGSAAVNGFKAYVAESRSRRAAWIVTSQGAELQEIQDRRASGDPRNEERNPERLHDAVLDNMGRNLSRQPTKTLATDFLERAVHLRSGTIDAKQAAWFRQETRDLEGKPALENPGPMPIEPMPEIVPTAEEHRVAWKAWEVAMGHVDFADGVDELVSRYIRAGGDLDRVDAAEERLSSMLAVATDMTLDSAESSDIVRAMRDTVKATDQEEARKQWTPTHIPHRPEETKTQQMERRV